MHKSDRHNPENTSKPENKTSRSRQCFDLIKSATKMQGDGTDEGTESGCPKIDSITSSSMNSNSIAGSQTSNSLQGSDADSSDDSFCDKTLTLKQDYSYQ